MKMNPTKIFTLVALLSVGVAGCKKEIDPVPELPKTLTEEIVKRPNLTILNAALLKTGLADTLKANRRLTVFAPNDTAFQALLPPFNTVAGITGLAATDPKVAELTAILRYHILANAIPTTSLQTGLDANRSLTLQGKTDYVYLSKTSGAVSINGARVREGNRPASNGYIHTIDRVNMPPTGNVVQVVAGSADFNLLAAALAKTGLDNNLKAAGPFTVFAPTDEAFVAALRSLTGNSTLDESAALNFINTQLNSGSTPSLATLTNVLLYHVASGRFYSPAIAAANLASLPTLNASKTIVLTTASGTVTVTGANNGGQAANLKNPDIHATNGVIHAIDRVLLPL